MEDAKRFVPFVLEAYGRLGPDAVTSLEYLRTLCRFPDLLCALTSVISAKHNNAQMALTPMGAIPLFGAQFRCRAILLSKVLCMPLCCKFLK
jgi:hypothetical protein